MIMKVSGFHSTSKRNVLRVMKRMEDEGYLKSQRKEFKVWCLKGDRFGNVEHRLMMNKFICQNGWYRKAIIEPDLNLGGFKFRPDFMIPMVEDAKKPTDFRFFEVDRTQKMNVNKKKIERYQRLGLRFEFICPAYNVERYKGYVYHVID